MEWYIGGRESLAEFMARYGFAKDAVPRNIEKYKFDQDEKPSKNKYEADFTYSIQTELGEYTVLVSTIGYSNSMPMFFKPKGKKNWRLTTWLGNHKKYYLEYLFHATFGIKPQPVPTNFPDASFLSLLVEQGFLYVGEFDSPLPPETKRSTSLYFLKEISRSSDGICFCNVAFWRLPEIKPFELRLSFYYAEHPSKSWSGLCSYELYRYRGIQVYDHLGNYSKQLGYINNYPEPDFLKENFKKIISDAPMLTETTHHLIGL